jgi:hypothetical protein
MRCSRVWLRCLGSAFHYGNGSYNDDGLFVDKNNTRPEIQGPEPTGSADAVQSPDHLQWGSRGVRKTTINRLQDEQKMDLMSPPRGIVPCPRSGLT